MDGRTSQQQRVTTSTNSAVPVSSQNAATQIYLIKGELPSPVKGGSTIASNDFNQKDRQVVRISSESVSEHLPLAASEPSTMIVATESPKQQTEVKTSDRNVLPEKKKRQSSKSTRTGSKKSSGTYTCEKCKKSYIHEASLKAHVRRTYCQENKSLVS